MPRHTDTAAKDGYIGKYFSRQKEDQGTRPTQKQKDKLYKDLISGERQLNRRERRMLSSAKDSSSSK